VKVKVKKVELKSILCNGTQKFDFKIDLTFLIFISNFYIFCDFKKNLFFETKIKSESNEPFAFTFAFRIKMKFKIDTPLVKLNSKCQRSNTKKLIKSNISC